MEFLGFLLKISFVTACPIEPAPPITKNLEELTISA
jgi:hypothetical protein